MRTNFPELSSNSTLFHYEAVRWWTEEGECLVLSRLDDDISAGLHVCLGDAKQIFTHISFIRTPPTSHRWLFCLEWFISILGQPGLSSVIVPAGKCVWCVISVTFYDLICVLSPLSPPVICHPGAPTFSVGGEGGHKSSLLIWRVGRVRN